jgi:hypothetical protein
MALSLGCHEVPAAMALFSRLHPLKREPMGSCLQPVPLIRIALQGLERAGDGILVTPSSNSWHITSSAWYLNTVYLSEHQSPSWIRAASSEVEPLIANDRSLKFTSGHPRRASYTYNLAGVLDLNTFMGLAIRVMAVRDSDSAR